MSDVFHPHRSHVGVSSNVAREISISVGPDTAIVLYPGAADHDQQLDYLDRLEAAVRTARHLMCEARRNQRPAVPG
ncbi:hypothetical protein ACFO4E_12815 [Nocardiopsis mangrovi]|uniref:Uncharacterized protein n=1 Tax=Nocardiopsis mangrovi TaxID=1179818 RepID=A0ABV9DXQ2_9ACTN